MPSIAVSGKALGSKRKLFADFSVPIDTGGSDGGDGGVTLRDLITTIVRQQVTEFEQRQHDRQFIRALTEKDISAGADAGKIDSGGNDQETVKINLTQATTTALEAFGDGLYLVAVDGNQQKELDAQLFLSTDSEITFIRLTLLAGG